LISIATERNPNARSRTWNATRPFHTALKVRNGGKGSSRGRRGGGLVNLTVAKVQAPAISRQRVGNITVSTLGFYYPYC